MVVEADVACPQCHSEVEGDTTCACPSCGAIYHPACWTGKCTAENCTGTVWDLAPVEAAPEPEPIVITKPFPWSTVVGVGWVVVLLIAAAIAIMAGVPAKTVLVLAVVVCALTFDYVNGMHDAGNAIATVISTRVLTPAMALLMAAVLNLLGALISTGVAKSIATKFAASGVDPLTITPLMILCGLVGASLWSYITAQIGLPVSTSHSLFGGLIGVFLMAGIPLNLGYMAQLGTFMIIAPLSAFVIGWILMTVLNLLLHRVAPFKLNKLFRILQGVSSAMMAFSHGSNDAQKAMGIITMALVSGGFIVASDMKHVDVPLWVKIACALVIALGTGFGGMRVIKTLGHKIIKLAPIHGFAAETVAAATIQVVTFMHVPISTTHVISSSILGIGASKRLSAVRWGVAGNIVAAWFFTIPTCAVVSALLYKLVEMCGLVRLLG
jgi:PiT family inorganic phosphate transporter